MPCMYVRWPLHVIYNYTSRLINREVQIWLPIYVSFNQSDAPNLPYKPIKLFKNPKKVVVEEVKFEPLYCVYDNRMKKVE